MVTYVWIGLILIFALAEGITLSLTSVWFAFGAVLALIVAALGGGVWMQIVFFIAGSALLLVFTRPIVTKYLKVGSQKTNVDAMIGRQAVVTETINNIDGVGQIKVGGLIWSARSENDRVIEVSQLVEIVRVAGVCAYVKSVADEE